MQCIRCLPVVLVGIGLGVGCPVGHRRFGNQGLLGQQRSRQFLRGTFVGPGNRGAAGCLRGQTRLVFRPKQVVSNGVDGTTHTADGRGQVFPTGPQLLDLGVEHFATLG